MKKNSRKDVARQGFLALMNGKAEVVGGDAAAAWHARQARPRS
ncbi:hypothetical protein ACFXOY_06055 [Streptomyces niveus]